MPKMPPKNDPGFSPCSTSQPQGLQALRKSALSPDALKLRVEVEERVEALLELLLDLLA